MIRVSATGEKKNMSNAPKIPKDWVTLVRRKTSGDSAVENETNTDCASEPTCNKRRRMYPDANHGASLEKANTAEYPKSSSGMQSDVGGTVAESMQDACNNILSVISKTRPGGREEGPAVDADELNMDCLMCRVSTYKAMLEDLFTDESVQFPTVPVVTKRYEESYMREPFDATERECVMGEECECNFIAKGEGFAGVEFLLPGEKKHATPQMCVLCHRRMVQSLYHDIIYSGIPFRGVIQRYGNICGQHGEYARDAVLICPPNGPVECMPFPLASHQRNRYTIHRHHGVRFVQQNGMDHEDSREHFHMAPSAVH